MKCWIATFIDYSNEVQLNDLINELQIKFDLHQFDFVVGLLNRELLTKSLVEKGFINTKYLLFGAAFEFYFEINKRASKL